MNYCRNRSIRQRRLRYDIGEKIGVAHVQITALSSTSVYESSKLEETDQVVVCYSESKAADTLSNKRYSNPCCKLNWFIDL